MTLKVKSSIPRVPKKKYKEDIIMAMHTIKAVMVATLGNQ